jgi:cytochrome c oxidase subunit 3
MLWKLHRGEIGPAYYAPLEVAGLYWTFVDGVWIFLYPAIYLLGRS